jgi:ABC-2 type transport system ATP-binding protein
LIRGLDLEATVSATIAAEALSPAFGGALEGLPGVVSAAVGEAEAPPRIRLQTKDVQATIVGLLELASRNGVRLDDLGSTRATLEDVFLARTGRSYEDEEPAPAEDAPAPSRRRSRAA